MAVSREESWVTARMRARKPTSGTTGRGMPTTRASVHPATAATEQRTEAPSHHQPSSVGCSPSAVRIVASRPRSVSFIRPLRSVNLEQPVARASVRSSPARATTTRQPAPRRIAAPRLGSGLSAARQVSTSSSTATAEAARRCTRSKVSASCVVSAPRTATSRPSWAVSRVPGGIGPAEEACTMASASRVAWGPDSSRGEVSACAVHPLQGHDIAGAAGVQRRSRPPPTPPTRTTTPGPRRGARSRRVSSSTVQRLSQGCSSRRTISSPCAGGGAPVHPAQVVAVAVLAGGGVVLAGGGDRPRPAVAAARPTRRRARPTGSVHDDRRDDEGVAWRVNERRSSHRPNGSVSRTASGPIE